MSLPENPLESSGNEITIVTSPFLLQALVYRTLSALYRALDTGDALTLTVADVRPIFGHPGLFP